MVEPPAVSTVLFSGSNAVTASLTHCTRFGMTEYSERSLVDALAQPPPTSVHNGW